MTGYHWFAAAAMLVSLIAFLVHFVRLLKLGKPRDLSAPSGSPAAGIVYSFTSGMNPVKKESAFLHLPTYSAGILFHISTFLALAWLIVSLTGWHPMVWPAWPLALFFLAGGMAGAGILIKRMTDKKLRMLSTPDDYLSNILVTLFQLFSGLVIFLPAVLPAYLLISGLLLLYMPLGKLKHAVYFFAARYQLGYFYGWRNVWPPQKAKK